MQKHKIVLLTVMLILALSTSVFADSFTIKASASPKKGGTISPSGKVTADSGENPQFTITPNTGYQIQDVIVDGVSQGAVNMYTFVNITQKHSIKAKFTKRTFTVMVAQGGKVSVSPIGARTVTYGKKINLKIKPNSEDVVPILLIDGKQVDASQAGNVYKYVLTVVSDTSVYATSAVEPKLTASTKVMDEATAQNLTSISADGIVLTFNGITPYLESLQPVDVIVSGVTEATPYGLLRKVTNVTIDGSQVTVETTKATLEDAIEEGEIIINQKLTAADIMFFVPLKEGVTLQEGIIPGPVQPQACLSLNHVFYDSDGDENTTNDQIALTGSACLDPTFNFALGMGWHTELGIPLYPELKNLTFSVGLSESIALELVANYTYSFSEKIPIAEIYFEPIVVSYFVFVPMLTVNVGIDGSLSAGITTSVTQNAGLTVGLSYSDGDWSPIADFTSGFLYSLPTLHIGAQAKVFAEPRFDLLLYGLVGPYARIQGYLDLRMDPLGDPWLLLYGGIEAGAGIKIGLFGATLADYEFPLFSPPYRTLLAQLAGNQPPTITSITANPSNVLVGGTSTVTVVAKDPEHDPLTCEWSTDKGTLSSTIGCDPVTWTAPGTLGTANVSVSVKDNKPGRSPVSRSVNIGICSYFSIDPASALYEKEGGTGSVNVSAPSGCAWIATSNDRWITITAGSSGSGNGTVSYTVAESRGSLPRTGTISAGKIFTVTQKGIGPLPICAYSIDPHSASYGSSRGSGSVSVTTQTGCSWDATSNASWITITAGSSGSGNGTVSYTVAANTGALRNGTMTIAGKTFSVSQEAPLQPPGPPTSLSASDGTYTDKVRIMWTAPTTGGAPTGYRIFRYTSNSSGSASEIGTSTGTSYDDYAGNTSTYWYWVKAYNSAGPGSFSNGDSGYRQAVVPCVPQLTSPRYGAVLDNGCEDLSNLLIWDFAWSACSGATQYHIYVKHPEASGSAIDTVVNTTFYHKEGYLYAPDIYRFGWRWAVRAMVNEVWGEWSPERTFDVEPMNTDCINNPPTITSLTAANPTVILGGTSTITVVASDLESDPLTCTWSTTGGSLSSTTGCGSVIWTAPSILGTYTVTVSITDNKAGHSPVTRGVTIGVEPICVPQLSSPVNGAVLDNGCGDSSNLLTWDFAWTACPGATQYNIWAKHPDISEAATAFVDTTSYRRQGYYAVPNIYRLGWRWKVKAMVNGLWGDWSELGTFNVEPLNTDCK
jgi:hypothetical protein